MYGLFSHRNISSESWFHLLAHLCDSEPRVVTDLSDWAVTGHQSGSSSVQPPGNSLGAKGIQAPARLSCPACLGILSNPTMQSYKINVFLTTIHRKHTYLAPNTKWWMACGHWKWPQNQLTLPPPPSVRMLRGPVLLCFLTLPFWGTGQSLSLSSLLASTGGEGVFGLFSSHLLNSCWWLSFAWIFQPEVKRVWEQLECGGQEGDQGHPLLSL